MVERPSKKCSMNQLDLKQQQVRDLAVSCFSEPLISNFTPLDGINAPSHCALHLSEKRLQWLRQLDRNPKPLLEFIEQAKLRRLGFYHEALWHFFLQQDEDVELIATNCQVQQAGRTIGEFDVIYRDLLRNQVIHLELAFKIYLLSPDQPASNLSHWLGPNLNDRLDLKLEHMLNHQCRLAQTAAGQEKLNDINIDEVEREISLRGYLFYGESGKEETAKNNVLNPGHLTGDWLPLSKAINLLDHYRGWLPLTNLQWISPVHSNREQQLGSVEISGFLQHHFEARQSPVLICAYDLEQSTSSSESYRLMITPDDWPQNRPGN